MSNPREVREALDRAFPIFQMGGLSGAMYPADEGEGQGWAISNEDWEVVAGVIRELIEDPVAVIRRGVESGTIKGEEVSLDGASVGRDVPDDLIELVFYMDREKGVEWFRRNFRVLVIPVSDGGSET